MRREPPGPKGHWLLGSLPDFRSDLLGLLSGAAQQYGDDVRLRLGSTSQALLLNHPDQIEEVMASSPSTASSGATSRDFSAMAC